MVHDYQEVKPETAGTPIDVQLDIDNISLFAANKTLLPYARVSLDDMRIKYIK